MNFSDVIAINKSESDIAFVPEHWGQGRATFGGLVAGIVLEKILPLITDQRPLRSMTISFVAPVEPGDLNVHTRVLREGKGATQIQATAYQQDKPVAVVLTSFGGSRESSISIPAINAPEMKAPEDITAFPYIKGLTPDFTQYFDYRYALENMPFMNKNPDSKLVGGWIKLKEECNQPAELSAILSLLDAWPPAAFCLLKKPASGSTLTWTISFIEHESQAKGDDWWQYQAEIQQSANGYSHVDATMWDKDGQPILLSRQTISVFA